MHLFIKTTDVDLIDSAKNTIFKIEVHFEINCGITKEQPKKYNIRDKRTVKNRSRHFFIEKRCNNSFAAKTDELEKQK